MFAQDKLTLSSLSTIEQRDQVVNDPDQENRDNTSSATRQSLNYYTYIDRDHSFDESLNDITYIYAATWIVYPLTQQHC